MTAPQPPKFTIGQSGRCYVLLEEVGSGATSRVFKAHLRDDPKQLVALKLARSAAEATAFANEAVQAFLGLSPRLVELVDLGVIHQDGDRAQVPSEPLDDDVAFLALGWIEGRPLDAALPNTEPLKLALAVARDIGEALADLHAAGLAHGDVKPANILYDGHRASLVDLGLCGPAFASALRGATPRYLATTDPKLGDARARDMLALGLVLAEICSSEVAAAEQPLAAARGCTFSKPVDRICAALLAPEPGARPSARWVCELGGAAQANQEDAARGARQLRAAYLRLRRHEIAHASTAHREAASWLRPAIVVVREARKMCERVGAEIPEGLRQREMRRLDPLSVEQRINWLAATVGSPAASWPSQQLAESSELELERALLALCACKPPRLWSLADIDMALREQLELVEPATWAQFSLAPPIDPAVVVKLSLAVARTPVDHGALEVIERDADLAPDELVVQAADALRLSGELGRARSLVLGRRQGEAVAVDVLRRFGDVARASALAQRVIEEDRDRDGRARACLARIHLDTGRIAEAMGLLEQAEGSAAVAEVSALVEHRRGNNSDALRHAERSFALATTPEARARAWATIAFVKRSTDPGGARRGYRQAVQHAIAAGAILEEASYRTGEAAACVDLGELEAAIQTGQRAALLFEHVLGRAAMAARAWLACAAAYAALDVTAEACHAAERAMALAQECGDTRAEIYACWSIADALAATQQRAVDASRKAAALVGEQPRASDDGVHTAARLLRHDASRADRAFVGRFDDLTRHPTSRSVFCRLAWWGARAERLAGSSLSHEKLGEQAGRVLTELVILADAEAPVPTIGKAMFAAARLAAAVGDTASLQRLDAARRAAARRVAMHTNTLLAEAARGCSWLHRHSAAEEPLAAEQALDIRQLVRALSERNSLRALLDQVLDVLLLWTGAERGLLLLRDPSGKLVPRSARNLARDDLHDEQLAVSMSLAQRALETGEPVVAVDAMEELLNSFDSVHSLRLRSVLALPLVAHGDVRGVVYLDDRMRRGVFGEREIAWAKAVAPVAALAISDAHTQKQLRRAVRRAERASQRLEQALAQKESALDVAERELAKAVGARETRFRYEEIVGESDALKKMLHIIDRVSVSDVPVLLRGESGSGKELVARAIHYNSPRANRPFVSENCAALPESLLESALFGHVKGAFTGAHRPRVGLFEAADGGNLFLDEIGEMSLSMQTKLLRVLEDDLVRPVGSTRTRQVDVRVVAATHRDLDAMVADGSFREDLYYRLNVITIIIPPLRERSADIPLLVDHLMGKHAAGRSVKLTRAARQRLMGFAWPGNVRQLENELRRALLLCDEVIDVEHLSIADPGAEPESDLGLNVRARVDRLEVELVREALGRTTGNQTQAAKLLGVSRYGLHKMMKRLGVTVERRSKG